MDSQTFHVVIINGSPKAESRLNGLINRAHDRLQQLGANVDTIAVNELPPEDLIFGNYGSEKIKEANEKVFSADAVIVASQVYKATYTGVLKTYLDLLPQKGLEGKIILPLFIGGTISHLLSIDYGMKPVLTALGATHILGGVFAEDGWVERTDDGGYDLTESLQDRLDQSVDQLMDEVRIRKLTNKISNVS